MPQEVKDPELLKKIKGPELPAPEHPVMKALNRMGQASDDAVRATANAMTFGGADKLAAFAHHLRSGTPLGQSLQQEGQLSQQAAQRSPVSTFGGRLIGAAAPATIGSKALGTVVPALSRTTIPSIMGNQAVTGSGMSAADAIAAGETPDLRKMGIAGGASALISGPLAIASRLTPGPAVRHAGRYMSESAKLAARTFADKARRIGVPLTAVEASSAVDPVAAAPLASAYNTAARLHEGAHAANEFNIGREPEVAATAKGLSGMLAQDAHPVEIQGAATKAIHDAENVVRRSAKPYYKRANPQFVKGLPQGPTVGEATSKVLKDPVKMEDIGKHPRNSIKFADVVKSELEAGERGVLDRDPYKAALYRNKADEFGRAMKASSPNYAMAEDIFSKGNQMLVSPLLAGPLGRVRQSKDLTGQAEPIFNVGTNREATASIDAIKRMDTHLNGKDAGQNLLASRVEDAANRNPLGFSQKVFPTEHSVEVAKHAAGNKAPQIMDTLNALRAVKPVDRTPVLESHSGLWHDLIRGLQRGAAHGVVSRLNDPNYIKNFGQMAGLERAIHGLTASQIADYLQKLRFSERTP